MRGATWEREGYAQGASVSIHAPRAGRDSIFAMCNFWMLMFQSTRPVRGATGDGHQIVILFKFQSTRPVRGATFRRPIWTLTNRMFQSTRPVRGATLSASLDLHTA